MNCVEPRSNSSIELCTLLSNKYGVPVIPVNCLELTEQEVNDILSDILYEFPISNVGISFPGWINSLEKDNYFRASIFKSVKENVSVLGNIEVFRALLNRLKRMNILSQFLLIHLIYLLALSI